MQWRWEGGIEFLLLSTTPKLRYYVCVYVHLCSYWCKVTWHHVMWTPLQGNPNYHKKGQLSRLGLSNLAVVWVVLKLNKLRKTVLTCTWAWLQQETRWRNTERERALSHTAPPHYIVHTFGRAKLNCASICDLRMNQIWMVLKWCLNQLLPSNWAQTPSLYRHTSTCPHAMQGHSAWPRQPRVGALPFPTTTTPGKSQRQLSSTLSLLQMVQPSFAHVQHNLSMGHAWRLSQHTWFQWESASIQTGNYPIPRSHHTFSVIIRPCHITP